MSDLDLEAKWWLPDKEQEPRVGKLTLNQQQKHGELLLYGAFPPREGVDIKYRYDYDIILDELPDGQKVTLNGCTLNWIHPYLTNFEQSSFSVKYILLGERFQSAEAISFSKIQVEYQGVGFEDWVRRFATQGAFGPPTLSNEQSISTQYATLGRPIRATISDRYIITVFYKAIKKSASRKAREEYIKEVPCFEIELLKGKCLDNYSEANKVLRDFLNFIFPKEVHIKSIYGIMENNRDSQGNIVPLKEQRKVQIFYRWKVSEMFKPLRDQPIFPRNIFSQTEPPEVQFEKYLKRWFRLSEKPIINLYCGVMFNPDMYIEHLFLGLAFAIDSYHRIFIRKETLEKQQYKQELDRIANLLPKEDEKKRLLKMAKSCYQPSIKEMVKDVYHEYFFLGDSLFKHKGEEDFSDKVKATRNYFSHGSEGGMKNVVLRGDDLTYLTIDVQLLLQFCILTQLGFSKLDIIRIFDPTQIPVWVNVNIESIERIKNGRSGIPITLILFSHFFYCHSPLAILNYYRTL